MTNKAHLIQGPITPSFIAGQIDKHQSNTALGAHSMFLGTVRADSKDNTTVTGIEYSAYEEMIAVVIQEIKDQLFDKYDDLACLHIYHSTGLVKTGEHSLFVMVSGAHRKQAIRACEECVELIKEKLPVWKKEVYSDNTQQWLTP